MGGGASITERASEFSGRTYATSHPIRYICGGTTDARMPSPTVAAEKRHSLKFLDFQRHIIEEDFSFHSDGVSGSISSRSSLSSENYEQPLNRPGEECMGNYDTDSDHDDSDSDDE